MQESESVVANWTCEMGNRSHESSEGNALALARGGRAEGLASDRAATLGNRHSAVIGTTRTRFKWRVRVPSRSEVGEGSTPEQVQTDALGEPSGAGAAARPQGLACKAGKAHAPRWLSLECVMPTMVVEHGLAHEVVVAMMSAITSRESEGPLGSRGHGMRGDLVSALHRASPPNERSSHAVSDEAGSKPHGRKASGESGAWNRTEEISPSGILEGLRET